MLAGAQLGITMASLGLGAIAEPAVASLIESGLHSVLELSDTTLHSISFVVALTLVVFFHMVVGEMAPKNVAIAIPEKSALFLAPPGRLYANTFRPFIHLLNSIANAVLRLLRVEPQDELISVHTAGEIGVMVTESAKEGVIKDWEHRLLMGAVGLSDLDAGAVMVPRTEIIAAPVSATVPDVEGVVVTFGHSRIPVYDGGLDNILGFVHAKDLLKTDPSARDEPLPRELIRPMLMVPESRKLQHLLLDMQRQQRHFALVLDEHGGTAGLVTLEDLLEELVGEIRDEYDEAEIGIHRLTEDRFVVPGTLRVDEALDRLGVELPEGDYDTIAGFIMERLGRVPKRRDVVEHDGWQLRVRSMHRRRVVEVLIERV
jgi:CBS domain containing-hemolysin-like protein